MEEGYDLTRDPIPVTPAQHYFMGGIKVDLNGRTSMKNLFAVGETSCNGVHGENRLGSNSLLESLVFSKRSAEAIKESVGMIRCGAADLYLKPNQYSNLQSKYKRLILNEIKRKDRTFYELWCCNEN